MNLSEKLTQVTDDVLRLIAVADIGKILNSTLDLDEVLSIILKTATEHLKAERGTVYLVDPETNELWSKVLQGNEFVEIRLPLGQGIAGHVAETGKSLMLKDAYADPRFNPDFDKKSGFKTKTILCAPMVSREGKMVGVFQIINKQNGFFNRNDLNFLDMLSVDACIAVENARLYRATIEKERLEKELEVAASVMSMILPKDITPSKTFDLSATSVSCKQVGGDYYDVIPLKDNHFALVVADVSGKGVPGALLVASLQASLRAYLDYYPGNLPFPPNRENDIDLKDLTRKLNQIIMRNSTEDKFITFFVGIIDTDKKTLNYVNAGHNPPLLFRGKTMEKLTRGGIPLGMYPFDQFEEGRIELKRDDTLVLFTDGVTEAENEKEELYSDERLEKLLHKITKESPEAIHKKVLDNVLKHMGECEATDDITLIVIRIK